MGHLFNRLKRNTIINKICGTWMWFNLAPTSKQACLTSSRAFFRLLRYLSSKLISITQQTSMCCLDMLEWMVWAVTSECDPTLSVTLLFSEKYWLVRNHLWQITKTIPASGSTTVGMGLGGTIFLTQTNVQPQ